MAAVLPLPATDGVGGASTPTPTPTPTAGAVNSKELESRGREYVAQERFNRRFSLPATDAHGELTVTYAVGGVDNADAPTLLFIGGLLGGRLLACIADYLCTKHGIRIVVTDRPGLGGSTGVKPSLRLAVWLETVPVLMRTINAQHVALASHSCGVIYALNTIYSMPWILPPANPKLYLFSPWVHPDHSGATLLSISSHLPTALINGSFESILRFANSTLVPTVHFSSVVSGALSGRFSKTRSGEPDPADREARFRKHERDDLCREYCGVSAAEDAAQSHAIMKSLFKQDISGSNHEALMVLQKDATGPWGSCDSYESYPDMLETKLRDSPAPPEPEQAERAPTSATTVSANPHKVALKVFWAEKDWMITKKGEQYFDKCFQRFARNAASQSSSDVNQDQGCLSYESDVVADTGHDTVFLPQYGAFSAMLDDVKGR